MRRALRFVAASLGLLASTPAAAQPRVPSPAPDGTEMVRLLGARAALPFGSSALMGVSALVRLPQGVPAASLGLSAVAPGIARLWSTPSGVVAFGRAHPTFPLEVAPPLHLLLDTARAYVHAPSSTPVGGDAAAPDPGAPPAADGSGALIGIADTGLDVTHPDFLDAQGHTRVAWLLDFSQPPRGVWPALESQYGTTDPTSGALVAGAVWSTDDINAALAAKATVPQDEVGHGTLVASCAAGNGAGGTSPYRGIAPGATLVVARIVDTSGNVLGNDVILRAVQFLFDRADAMHQPIVVSLSLGSDFGPHDGTMAWEQTLASHVGPDAPGHVLVAAAGNSGSIAPSDDPVHENVLVDPRETTRVPIDTSGAQDGAVEVWVAMHPDASVRVGLDGPNGTWIAPVADAKSAGAMTDDYEAAVVNGSEPTGSPVPPQSHGAVVLWSGKWPSGTYSVTLAGSGNVDLYVQGEGDAVVPGAGNFGFAHGVRGATITLPGTEPDIISVGCTINKASWFAIDREPFGLTVPILDAVGGMPEPDEIRSAIDGEPCWFSSAGPTLTGAQKPEIAAPGGAIVGALSAQAVPPVATSIFTTSCPGGHDDQTCQEIDSLHGVSAGTSFSAPIVAGTVAVLLQRNASATQADVLGLLQGGAHHLRGPAPYDDQSGVGEVDVTGSLAVESPAQANATVLPSRAQSWLTAGAEYVSADGAVPVQFTFDLRGSPAGSETPPTAAGFDESRFAMYAYVRGTSTSVSIAPLRRGPGVRVGSVAVPAGLGGMTLVVGGTFDGIDVVEPKALPIATDAWNADYPPRIAGGCQASQGPPPLSDTCLILAAAGTLLGATRRRRSASIFTNRRKN
jgi:subtilisin family serine protease